MCCVINIAGLYIYFVHNFQYREEKYAPPCTRFWLACWEINLKKVNNQQLNGAISHILQSLL